MTHAGLTSTALWLMFLLGAYYGLNPGVGWLFAGGMGRQGEKGGALLKPQVLIDSVPPAGWSHGLSIENSGSRFSARRGSTLICSGQLRWWPPVFSLSWYSQLCSLATIGLP